MHGLAGSEMSNTHYFDYNTNNRSKLKTLDTCHWWGKRKPTDKMSKQHQETQVRSWVEELEIMSDFRVIVSVSASKASTITHLEKGQKKKKKILNVIWLPFKEGFFVGLYGWNITPSSI